jgi:general secretion pathway protein N
MRILKILVGLLVLALVVAGVFAWTLPADVGYRYGAKYIAPLILTGIRGTVWDGHADGVSAFGRDLGELDWRAQKSPLLFGRVVADVRIQGAGVDAAGVLARGSDGSLSAHDLRFSFPAALLEPALDMGQLKLLGGISGLINHATLANATLGDASGSARWSDAGVSGQVEARFSDLLAQFASQPDGSIVGTAHDDGRGDLAVNGTFNVRLGAFDVEATLAARNNDPQVADMLRYVGQMQPDGSSKLVVHGQMLKVF